MARYSFGSKAGKVRARTASGGAPPKEADEVVRALKQEARKPPGEDYRERSLALHGTVCARCGRDFAGKDLKLLTVHHRDGDHRNNPADGSNWENLCVYCHDDAHSRGVLAEHVGGQGGRDERPLAHGEEAAGAAGLGDLLRQALERKGKQTSR
ncbi:MAG: YajD family HNH nuclease [Deferrisomatales bacterium]|nr:YajD family HNH nuclease [Deferrisomatales bacterium]